MVWRRDQVLLFSLHTDKPCRRCVLLIAVEILIFHSGTYYIHKHNIAEYGMRIRDPFHYYIVCYVGGFCGMILKQHLSFARHMVSTSLLQMYSLNPRLFLLLQNSLGMRLAELALESMCTGYS